jgi:hypothetical protein
MFSSVNFSSTIKIKKKNPEKEKDIIFNTLFCMSMNIQDISKMNDQLSEVRYLKRRRFEKEQHEKELFEKLSKYLEFNPVKRRQCILTHFFMKVINKMRKANFITESDTKKLSDIPGIRRLHIQDICIDLYEFEYLKMNIKPKYWPKCRKEYEKIRRLVYQQNFEFFKCLHDDQCKKSVNNIQVY